jgi:transposase
MRPQGSAAELERRRCRAIALMEQGESPTVIARILGVARPSLYRWRQMARAHPAGLAARPHPGPTPGLSAEQLQELEQLLLQGAPAHGWDTDIWTCKRVAEVIRRVFGIAYHPEHVRTIVYRRLSWSSQQPERRARERDEAAIGRWRREEFPRIKKRRSPARHVGVSR